MTIVHVVNFFLPDHAAGTENYVYNIALLQQKNGHEVFVVRPDYWGKEDYVYEGVNVKFYAEEKRTANKAEILGIAAPAGLHAFEQLLKELKPRIVHFHEINGSNGITYFHIHAVYSLGIKQFFTAHLPTITCATSTLFYKNRVICDGVIRVKKCSACVIYNRTGNDALANFTSWVSNSALSIGKKTGIYLLPSSISSTAFLIDNKKEQLAYLAKKLDGIIVLTKWYKKVLLENGFPNEKIILIQQGINPGYFLNEVVPIVKRNSKRLVFVGRITKVKGLHLLIDALKKIQYPIQLDVYGGKVEPDYFDACLEEAKKNNVDVEWKGLVASNKIVQLLKNYDALVLPSYFSEMSPLVIQEAFLAGVPVIASNAYGNAEQIINGKNGLLFEFGNSSSLQNVIEDFYNNYSKAQWSINFTSNTFETVVKELDTAYKRVVNEEALVAEQ